MADRISELPDAILHEILSLAPMKSAVRISVLSRRWRKLMEHYWLHTETLDFGEEFAETQTQKQFVNTVNRYLLPHRSNKIKKFQLFFHPGVQYQVDAEKWVEFAIQRSVENLDINFNRRLNNSTSSQPGDPAEETLPLPAILYRCNSLTYLKLGHCDFNPPLDFTGLRFLQSLYLKDVKISDSKLECILSNCPLLENLSLVECCNLESIKILGVENLQLKSLLVLACYYAYEIVIRAPNLKSFHFCGDVLYEFSFQNVSALEDVYMRSDDYEHTEPEHDYRQILSGISHVKILTICTAPLMDLAVSEKYNLEALPISFPNLQELQIIISALTEENLDYTYGFFKQTVYPCLERIFIEILCNPDDSSWPTYHIKEQAEEPTFNCYFNDIKTIEINNFHGSATEMKLVKFFLSRAVLLELLVLVVAKNSDTGKAIGNLQDSTSTSQSGKSHETPYITVHDQLLNMPKASKDARIVLCEQEEVSSSLYPKHTEYYHAY